MDIAKAELNVKELLVVDRRAAYADVLLKPNLVEYDVADVSAAFLLVGGCFLPPVALILVVMPLIQPSLA